MAIKVLALLIFLSKLIIYKLTTANNHIFFKE